VLVSFMDEGKHPNIARQAGDEPLSRRQPRTLRQEALPIRTGIRDKERGTPYMSGSISHLQTRQSQSRDVSGPPATRSRRRGKMSYDSDDDILYSNSNNANEERASGTKDTYSTRDRIGSRSGSTFQHSALDTPPALNRHPRRNPRQGEWSDWVFDHRENRFKRTRDYYGRQEVQYHEDSVSPPPQGPAGNINFVPGYQDSVDTSKASRMFGRMAEKAWKSSNTYSPINSIISKDNTMGEAARQAKLFADFGQKMKTCAFISFQKEEDTQPPETPSLGYIADGTGETPGQFLQRTGPISYNINSTPGESLSEYSNYQPYELSDIGDAFFGVNFDAGVQPARNSKLEKWRLAESKKREQEAREYLTARQEAHEEGPPIPGWDDRKREDAPAATARRYGEGFVDDSDEQETGYSTDEGYDRAGNPMQEVSSTPSTWLYVGNIPRNDA
jgi:hypothetical protein